MEEEKLMRFVRFACVFAALAAAASIPMLAQSFDAVEAHVPFAMTIGNLQLPAGDYRITPVSDSVLLFRSADGRVADVAPVLFVDTWNALSQTALEFRREGGEYDLNRICVNGVSYDFAQPDHGGSRAGTDSVAVVARSIH